MRRSPLLAVLLTLAASPAFAQDDDDMESVSLKGGSRISLQGGGRFAFNNTFYDSYYGRNPGLERAPRSLGAPLGIATFAYSATDSIEVGIDLFGSLQQLELTGQPRLTAASYGAMVGLRYQGWVDLGPHGTVPFLSTLTGPLLASTRFEGQKARETLVQAWALGAGATMRLTPRWGLCAEYRFMFARAFVGQSDQRFSTFNLGGNWLSLGVTYTFPKEPSSPFERPF